MTTKPLPPLRLIIPLFIYENQLLWLIRRCQHAHKKDKWLIFSICFCQYKETKKNVSVTKAPNSDFLEKGKKSEVLPTYVAYVIKLQRYYLWQSSGDGCLPIACLHARHLCVAFLNTLELASFQWSTKSTQWPHFCSADSTDSEIYFYMAWTTFLSSLSSSSSYKDSVTDWSWKANFDSHNATFCKNNDCWLFCFI